MNNRIIVKATHKSLPMIKDRYPFLYLEHGRLEIDDSSIKWISADNDIFAIPAATISTILLGPGTSITHEAVKILASLNTTVCWTGEDSLLFYAVGVCPTANTRNLKKQISLATNSKKSLEIARKMFLYRFPNEEVENQTLNSLMAAEGARVRTLYSELSKKYSVNWKGRNYTPGEFQLSDLTNQLITSCNTALYAMISSIIYSLGLTPKIGFIHSSCPLPFAYDIADLYKEHLVFDLAFLLTAESHGVYNKYMTLEKFRERVIEFNFMKKCPEDILNILGLKK